MAWAAEQRTGSPTRKAVLMALANAANHHTGRCFPSVERLAHETEASERTVRRALDDLEAAGLIARERRRRDGGTLGTYVYRFPPADTATGRPPDTATGRPPVTTAALNQEEPNQEATANAVADSARARENAAVVLHGSTAEEYVAPVTVDRKRVTSEEATRAALILSVWNQRTGQRLRAKEWLGKIIMRIREYPEATNDDHAVIIETALENPWWRGPASPSVVYGNGAQFERSIQAVREKRREDTRIEDILTRVRRAA